MQLQRGIPIAPGHRVPTAYQSVVEGLAGAEVPFKEPFIRYGDRLHPTNMFFPNLYNAYFSLERRHNATFHPHGIFRHNWFSPT